MGGKADTKFLRPAERSVKRYERFFIVVEPIDGGRCRGFISRSSGATQDMDNFAVQLAECQSSLLRICSAIDPEECDHRVLLIAADDNYTESVCSFDLWLMIYIST